MQHHKRPHMDRKNTVARSDSQHRQLDWLVSFPAKTIRGKHNFHTILLNTSLLLPYRTSQARTTEQNTQTTVNHSNQNHFPHGRGYYNPKTLTLSPIPQQPPSLHQVSGTTLIRKSKLSPKIPTLTLRLRIITESVPLSSASLYISTDRLRLYSSIEL